MLTIERIGDKVVLSAAEGDHRIMFPLTSDQAQEVASMLIESIAAIKALPDGLLSFRLPVPAVV